MELDNKQIVTDRPIRPFLRRFQANDKDLETLLKTYRDKNGLAILIHLRNTLGKEF